MCCLLWEVFRGLFSSQSQSMMHTKKQGEDTKIDRHALLSVCTFRFFLLNPKEGRIKIAGYVPPAHYELPTDPYDETDTIRK